MKHQVIIIDIKCLVKDDKFYPNRKIQPPKDGVRNFLEELSYTYTVKLYYRGKERRAINWIAENNFLSLIDDVITKKEKCDLFIDKLFIDTMKDIPELRFLCS